MNLYCDYCGQSTPVIGWHVKNECQAILCKECERRFSSRQYLARHRRYKHQPNVSP